MSWQRWISQERLSDNGKLMYPSITFCTKYIWQDFPGVMEIINNNKSIDYQVRLFKGKRVKKMNIWEINRNHNYLTVYKLSINPCLTSFDDLFCLKYVSGENINSKDDILYFFLLKLLKGVTGYVWWLNWECSIVEKFFNDSLQTFKTF